MREAGDVVSAWIDAFNAGDVGRIVALYDPQATLHPTTAAALAIGRSALGVYFERVFGMAMTAALAPGLRLEALGDDACCAIGFYDVVREGRAAPARFTFVLARREDGWRIVHHHSSSLPA